MACGLAAPSSKNAAPWRFHVVQDREVLDRLASAAESHSERETWVPFDPRDGVSQPPWQSTVVESAEVLRQVPAAIVIENRGVFGGGLRGMIEAAPERLIAALRGYGFESIGLGAALENMWLAAGALGLSAAFLGDLTIAEDAIRAELAFEGDLAGVLALGHSDAAPPPRRPAPVSTSAPDPVVWH